MSWDTIWQIIRYLLIAGGSFLVGKGYVSAENVEQLIGAIGSIGAILWGLYVKFGTTAVPNATADRVDVPTVSGATGAVTPTPAGRTV